MDGATTVWLVRHASVPEPMGVAAAGWMFHCLLKFTEQGPIVELING